MNRNLLAIAASIALPAGTAQAVDVIPLFDLGGRPGFHVQGLETDDWLGLPVAGVGDFNGDGIGDFVIGAEHGSPGSGGASYLVFGRATPFPASFDLASLNGSNGLRIDSGLSYGNSLAVAGAGDFNADGYADLLMGTSDVNMARGRVCVVFGGATHPPVLSLAFINGGNGTCYYGVSEYDNIGYVTSAAGDFNGDGIDDIAFGSVLLNARAVDDGGIYVVFGHGGPFPPGQSLATLNGSNGFLFVGKQADDKLGVSAAPAGDVNGDGRDDLLIGSESEESRRGAVYLLFGRPTPLSQLMSPSDIDGATGVRLLGARNLDGLGRGVGGVDFDQDGYSDVLAGTTFGGLGNQNGSASVVYGHHGPYPAQIDVGSLDGNNGRAFFGTSTFERLGEQSASAGDINGDGYPDLMLSAPFADFAGPDTGSVYIVYGRPARGPAQLLSSGISGRVGFRMDGFDRDGYCGQRQRPVGDINGDGIDDLIVGCNYSSGGGSHRGAAHVLYGNATPKVRASAATVASMQPGQAAGVFALADVAAAQYLDAQPFAGAAISTSPANGNGQWSFRQNGSSPFQPVPQGLSPGNALVLAATAQIRFEPSAGFVGEARIALRFWDGSGNYPAGLRDIDGDIGTFGGFANDANLFEAVVRVREGFGDGFE